MLYTLASALWFIIVAPVLFYICSTTWLEVIPFLSTSRETILFILETVRQPGFLLFKLYEKGIKKLMSYIPDSKFTIDILHFFYTLGLFLLIMGWKFCFIALCVLFSKDLPITTSLCTLIRENQFTFSAFVGFILCSMLQMVFVHGFLYGIFSSRPFDDSDNWFTSNIKIFPTLFFKKRIYSILSLVFLGYLYLLNVKELEQFVDLMLSDLIYTVIVIINVQVVITLCFLLALALKPETEVWSQGFNVIADERLEFLDNSLYRQLQETAETNSSEIEISFYVPPQPMEEQPQQMQSGQRQIGQQSMQPQMGQMNNPMQPPTNPNMQPQMGQPMQGMQPQMGQPMQGQQPQIGQPMQPQISQPMQGQQIPTGAAMMGTVMNPMMQPMDLDPVQGEDSMNPYMPSPEQMANQQALFGNENLSPGASGEVPGNYDTLGTPQMDQSQDFNDFQEGTMQ